MHPFRLALRRLASTPGFAVAVVVCLTLGVGANGIVFGALYGLLQRPLPFTDDGAIAWVFARPALGSATVREKLTGEEATALSNRKEAFSAFAVIGDRSLYVERRAQDVTRSGVACGSRRISLACSISRPSPAARWTRETCRAPGHRR
jgi:hypothetical protein